MGLGGCRSSGELTVAAKVFSGRCKLVSIHATNTHATDASIVTIYDNLAASGKVVAKMVLPGIMSVNADSGGAGSNNTASNFEYDMHGVICANGLYFSFAGGTPSVTIEFS